ncbi:hypothetical protein GPA19_01315 [Azoarcus indigens]|uniref:Polysaccharide pyruvyl transferase WcaK-like protein n=1 Tax=Azoarcus indigens TaxID=29545 RepID=A0A4R6EFS7_9RHOO|nr:polysaccharide pyruvyl transferase family protein [Azoarcus indigens]NMG63590.1 hypothetical protein [Azoarcus indigens]TDN57142.1 polysaccharide pyruvyl transferase WcaK-like protein [Azoarcus indigens]
MLMRRIGEGAVRLARWQASSGNRSRGSLRAAIIPPAIPGSLGDAAMISASADYLRSVGFKKVDLFFGSEWPLDVPIDDFVAAERYFYHASNWQLARLINRLPAYSHMFFIGADVIDGAYNPGSVRRRLSLLEEANRLGIHCTVLGSSYNEAPEESTRAKLRTLPEQIAICARDPVSHGRLASQLERPILQTADLAFLLEPRRDHPAAAATRDWISARRAAGDRILAVNANYLHAAKLPALRGALTGFLRRLLEEKLSIVLVPHDTRSDEPDEALLAKAAAGLPDELHGRIRMMPPASPGAIKSVLANVDLLASGRLHAIILALGSGTPVFGFTYQGKFEGLLQLLELNTDTLLRSPAELAAHPRQIAELVLGQLERAGELREHIARTLPKVLSLSRSNFGGFDIPGSIPAQPTPDAASIQ